MGIFKKKNEEPKGLVKSVMLQTHYDESGALNETVQIMANDGVNICAEACACCWDTKLPSGYEDRAIYVSKRTKIGHDSVTEHANNVYYMEIPDEKIIDLAEFLSIVHYNHTVYKHSRKFDKGYLLIGGSWRAYKDILLKMPTIHDNYVVTKMMQIVYRTINSAAMTNLIVAGAIEDNFDNSFTAEQAAIFRKVDHKSINDNIEVVNVDDFDVLLENIKTVCPEPELFTPYDLLDLCTVTILFKNMSRVITQQLTRHRNAITQESQRYVNYSNGAFNSPAMFKEKYDPDYQYSIQFGKSSHKITLQEIGDNIAKIYGQLNDKERTAGHELQPEDARAFLPNNIRCNKLYMTFTWRSFFKFLFLREDKHAQAEIRKYATELGTWFRELYPNHTNLYSAVDGYRDLSNDYTYPLDGTLPAETVDEVISEEEIIAEMEAYAANTANDEPIEGEN